MLFFEPSKRDRALFPWDPFKALVAPRPIGWISTVDKDGRLNLAPYSFFNAVAGGPPVVMFSSDGKKDSINNAEATGEFVCNLVTYDLRDQMNASAASLPHGESEFDYAGIETAPSVLVKPPRVKASPWALECKLLKIVPVETLDGSVPNHMALGQVVGIHIDESFLKEGRVDTAAMRPIARSGYDEYGLMDNSFRMKRPG